MKRILTLTMTLACLLLVLTACGEKTEPAVPVQATAGETEPAAQPPAETEPAQAQPDRGFTLAMEITTGGSHVITGEQIGTVYVDADGEKVELVLDNAAIAGVDAPGIWIVAAKEVTILASSGESTITIPEKLAETETVPNAAVYSMADLALSGGAGTLRVYGGSADGINCRDSLHIQNLTLTLDAADDGLVGKDELIIDSSDLRVYAQGDGLKSTNDESPDRGMVTLLNSQLAIHTGDDAVQAFNAVTLMETNCTIDAGQDGLKAGTKIALQSGALTLTTGRDAFRMDEEDGLGEKAGLVLGEGTVFAAGLSRGSVLPALCSGQAGALFQLPTQGSGSNVSCIFTNSSFDVAPAVDYSWVLVSESGTLPGEYCILALADATEKTATLEEGVVTVR